MPWGTPGTTKDARSAPECYITLMADKCVKIDNEIAIVS
jgi:hypothetical protein